MTLFYRLEVWGYTTNPRYAPMQTGYAVIAMLGAPIKELARTLEDHSELAGCDVGVFAVSPQADRLVYSIGAVSDVPHFPRFGLKYNDEPKT